MNARNWIELLEYQYDIVSNSEDGRPLLLAVRKFVAFLDNDPQTLQYLRELDSQWKLANRERDKKFDQIRTQAIDLESQIKKTSSDLHNTIAAFPEPPDTPVYHVIDSLPQFAESNLSEEAFDSKDDLEVEVVHTDSKVQSQTGFICSRVWSMAQRLNLLAESIHLSEETTSELFARAEGLQGENIVARRKLNFDYLSSGQYALEQLRTVVEIFEGGLFTRPDNLQFKKRERLADWKALILEYAPSAFQEKAKSAVFQIESDYDDLDKDVYPLVRRYVRQIFEELNWLANSRLAHQRVVERYKQRCETYDWKEIRGLIDAHAEEVKEQEKSRHEFEDLLTLHFARYLFDNGYPVHYRLRDGVHEPDLIGDNSAPIVVEAKVVGQPYGTKQGKKWIDSGLRSLLAYLEKYYSDYGVTDGYLMVFRIEGTGYTFLPAEWKIDQFTIVPKVINIGRINKEDDPEVISLKEFLPE